MIEVQPSDLPGSGSGYGSGYGDGWTSAGRVGSYDVLTHPVWPVVRVGCQAHTIEDWREHWREIAVENEVSVSATEVDALLRCAGREA